MGRPIRLNRVELETNGKDEAQLLFWGDIHLGYPQCELEKAKAMLDWAVERNVYVILMGDLIECGLSGSIGDSVYQQNLNPQAQMEMVLEILSPIVETGRVIGLHSGNHENRISKATGINISKIMAKMLNVPFLGYSCWSLLKVGNINYTLYSTHGCSGSIFEHTKLNAVIKLSHVVRADIIAMGHTHGLDSATRITQDIDLRSKTVKEFKTYCLLTGAYLGWDGSYGQEKNYPIPKIGSPKVKLSSLRKDIHLSL
jgi:hypothetical protein